MMRAVPAGWDIGQPDELSESVVVKTVGSEEIRVLIVARGSPEVSQFLWLQVTPIPGRRFKWWSWDLENWQRD